MSKNFSQVPQVRFNRSKFDLSHGVKTTLSVGRLVPIDVQEVLPGDSFSVKSTCVARLTSSFLKPVIDNAYMDVFHFFVPLRLCFDKAEQVFGVAKPSSYVADSLESIPTLPAGTVVSGSIADYMGIPVGNVPKGVSVLPFRAFAKIYNDWFRNQNTVDEVFIQTGETKSSEHFNGLPFSPNNYLGMPPMAGKKKDYFTSCLPKTQKGIPVIFSLGDVAPVYSKGVFDENGNRVADGTVLWQQNGNGGHNISMLTTSKPSLPGEINDIGIYNATAGQTGELGGALAFPGIEYARTHSNPYLTNTVADISSVSSTSVNDLRFAFQLQKMLERDALYGSRYNEYLLGHFGVSSPDSRLQFSEYLGGGRIPISVQQVAQTSSATQESPLANVGGFSLSVGNSRYSKGFVEHGYVITVACVRTLHTYSQGIPKMFSRTSRNDFYDPLFANLGEQPVYKSELFVDGSEENLKGDIFGYNEAWAEYRYNPSKITGQLRSGISNSLDIWHFGDNYTNAPVLSQTFTEETPTYFDRTVSVPSSSQDNFLCDFWLKTSAIRVMPVYSTPGLIDHH